MQKHDANVPIDYWKAPIIKCKGTDSKSSNLLVKNRWLFFIITLCLFIWSGESYGQCNTPAACDAACPAICITDATLNGVASSLCRGTTTQLLCLDWNGAGDPATINVDYTLTPSLGETISLVPNATMDQVCVVVDIPTTADCVTTEVALEINSITPDPATAPGNCTLAYDLNISSPLAVSDQECDVNTGTITFLNLPLLPTLNGQLPAFTVFPDPANFMQYTVQEDAACGIAPAIIPVPNTCPPTVVASATGNTPATAEVCEPPTAGVDGAYSWDISSNYPVGEGGCPPTPDPAVETGVIPFCPAEPACSTCPTAIVDPIIPIALCYSEATEPVLVCYTFDADPTGVILTINGTEATPGIDPNTLCGSIPVVFPQCDPTLVEVNVAATCEGAAVEGITDGVVGSYTVYPNPANFVLDVTPSAGCGEAPVIVDSTCPTLTAQGWVDDMAPQEGCPPVGGTYSWTQTIPTALAEGPCGYDDGSGTEPVAGCDNCPTCPSQGVALYQPVCAPDPMQVCIDLLEPADDTVILDVDGFTASGTGSTQICVVRPTDDVTCEPVNAVITATCNGDPILIELGFAPPTIFPNPADFVIDVTPSAGCGEAPVIVDSTCPTLTTEGWVDDMMPQNACPPVEGTYFWTQTPPTFEFAPCEYADGSGTEPVAGCSTCTDCPTSATVSFEPAVCSDGMLEVCVTFDTEVTPTTTIDLDGTVYDGSAGGTQICGEVLAPTNESCSPSEFGFTLVAQCGETIYDLGIFLDPMVYPAPFTVEVVQPACDGEGGSATVVSAAGEACTEFPPVQGTPGVTGECPGPGTPATLSYSFGPFFEGTACQQDVIADDISIVCNPTDCVECPASATLTYPSPVCDGALVNVCLDFGTPIDPATVLGTINGLPLTIDDTGFAICTEIQVDNASCIPIDFQLDPVLTCGGADVPINFPDSPLVVYPNLVITIVDPTCEGEAGSASITSVVGEVCTATTGTVGVPNVCPSEEDTDASLAWDFNAEYGDHPCIEGELAGSITTDCFQTCPGECNVVPPTVTVEATETCEDGSVVGPFTVTSTGGSGGDIYYGVSDPNDLNTPGVITVVSQSTTDIETEINTNFLTNEFCIINITIVPADLEAFIVAFNALCDDPAFAALCPQFGLPLDPATTTLVDIFNLNQSLGGEVTTDFIEQLINFGAGGTVDAGVLFGLPADVIVLEIPTVCYVIGEEVCVAPVESCSSEECVITEAIVSEVTCSNNDTPDDPNDDTFTVIVTVNGTNTSGGWAATDPNATTGSFGTIASLGPYPISGGALNFIIADLADETCTFPLQVEPPPTCSNGDCAAVAGTATIEGAETCEDGTVTLPLTASVTGASGGASYSIVTDGSGGTIVDVNGDLSSAAVGVEICVTPFTYDEADFAGLITAINQWCTDNPAVCGFIPGGVLPLPTTATLEDIFDLAAGLGATIDINTILALINNGAGGSVDLGAALGLPANLVVIDIPAICFDLGEEVCVTPVASCPVGLCAIDAAIIADIICNNNDTPDDPNDDTFTFSITVTGVNTSASWAANDPNATSGTYGTAVSFGPYAISGGALSFTITDSADETCTFPIQVEPPATCSNGDCAAVAGTATIEGAETCEDGTVTLPLTASVTGASGGASYSIVTDGSGGTIVDVNGDLSSAAVGVEICVTPFTYDEADFAGLITAINQWCTDNPAVCGFIPGGVLPLPTTATLEDIFDLAAGLGATIDINTILALINNGAGGSVDLGAALGLPANLVVIDIPAICFDLGEEVCVTPVASCPVGLCAIDAAVIADIVCNNNDTPDDPNDDTFTFTITVTGVSTSASWTANDLNATSGAYGTAVSFGPYAISGGALSFTITDSGDETCTFPVQVDPPATCSIDPSECAANAGTPDFPTQVCAGDDIDPLATPTDASIEGCGELAYVYLILDGPSGVVLDVTNDGVGVTDTLEVGEQVCYVGVVFCQAEFDAIVQAAIDFGLPIALGSGLPELYDLAITFGLITPGAVTVTDIVTLIETQLPLFLGIDAPCLAVSEEACYTAEDCGTGGGCQLEAGIVTSEVIDTCTGGQQLIPITVAYTLGTGGGTEFIVLTDATTGNIITVATEADIQTFINDNPGEYCLTPFSYLQEDLDAIITTVNDALAGLGVPPLIPTGGTIGDLFAAIGAIGGGAPITIADVTGFVDGLGGSIDIGTLLGLPIPLVIEIPALCYNLGEELCVEAVEECPCEADNGVFPFKGN